MKYEYVTMEFNQCLLIAIYAPNNMKPVAKWKVWYN